MSIYDFTANTTEAQGAVAWVNQLSHHNGFGFDDSLYEVYSVIGGSVKFCELRNKATVLSDTLLDSALLLTTHTSGTQTNHRLSQILLETQVYGHSNYEQWCAKNRGTFHDPRSFRDQLQRSMAKQLKGSVASPKVVKIEHIIPTEVSDLQGRVWHVTWEARVCMAGHGEFHYTVRRLHSWRPKCVRSQQVFAHLSNEFRQSESKTSSTLEVTESSKPPASSTPDPSATNLKLAPRPDITAAAQPIRPSPKHVLVWTEKGIAAIEVFKNAFPNAAVKAAFTDADLLTIQATRAATTESLVATGVVCGLSQL